MECLWSYELIGICRPKEADAASGVLCCVLFWFKLAVIAMGKFYNILPSIIFRRLGQIYVN